MRCFGGPEEVEVVYMTGDESVEKPGEEERKNNKEGAARERES